MADQTSPADNVDEVLASTLVWAFIPIALNTMTQPSGRVLGFHSWYNFALRISPIVCGVNAIATFIELLYRTYAFQSLKVAFLGIAAHRFKARSDTDVSGGALERLRKNSIFRIGLFLIGALPQAVMLFASRGIPVAQACCTAYLASFLLDETVLYWSSNVDISELDVYGSPIPFGHVVGQFNGPAGRFHYWRGPEIFIGLSGIFFDFYLIWKNNTGLKAVLMPIVFSLACLGIARLMAQARDDVYLVLYYTRAWSPFLIAFLASKPLDKALASVLVFFGVSMGFVVIWTFAGKAERDWSLASRIGLYSSRSLASYSLLNYTMASLIYLGLHYTSDNTYKPHWTNWLG